MTDEERDQAIHELVLSYLESATPEQWHVYAARSNYDDNLPMLRWLVDNPKLDRGTALLIYWYLGAAWYVQYASEEDIEDYQQEDFEVLKLIEQRYAEGFYAASRIWFAPEHSEGGGPGDYPDLPKLRPVPVLMLEEVGTEPVDLDPEQYDDGIPFEVAEKIEALFDDA
ncbi:MULTISPECIES: DUF4274 domain-containing protein [unclassified Variovorax]|uniref:DUF4274 domain-containing protein n=1 Tax=unclassified Variovorax TaxID=663243 RepID=UPI0008C6D527|nr:MULTISPECIES: DUF4274 domain-containing protein [unclassified Variovorax]SEJ02384.1 protein of unknown function [Variovorax sp. OK202]SFB91951.1 protein of unknown function [Variovorax sp. OK212]